jgi:hypothetical protein
VEYNPLQTSAAGVLAPDTTKDAAMTFEDFVLSA